MQPDGSGLEHTAHNQRRQNAQCVAAPRGTHSLTLPLLCSALLGVTNSDPPHATGAMASDSPSPYHRLRAESTDATGGDSDSQTSASPQPPPLSSTPRQRGPAAAATAAASSASPSAAATAAMSSSPSAAAASPSSRPSWGRMASEQHRTPIVMKPPSRHARTSSSGAGASINVPPAASGGKHHAATLRLPPPTLASPMPGAAASPQPHRSGARNPSFMGSPRQASMRALRLLAQPNNDDVPSSSSSSSSSDDDDSAESLRRKLRRGSGGGGGGGSGQGSGGNSGSNSRPLSRQGSQHSLFISGSGAGPTGGEHSIVLEGDEAAALAADTASYESRLPEEDESESSAEEEEAIIQRWNQQVAGGGGGATVSAVQPAAVPLLRNVDGSAHVGSMPVQITSALNGRTGPIDSTPSGSPAGYGSVSNRGSDPVDIAGKRQGNGAEDERRDSGPNSGSNSAAVSVAGSLVDSGSMVDAAGYMAASSPGVERRRNLAKQKSVRYGTMPSVSASASSSSSSRRKHSLAGTQHRFDSVAGLQAAAAAAALDPTQSPDEPDLADHPESQRSQGRSRSSGGGKRLRWKTVLRRIPYVSSARARDASAYSRRLFCCLCDCHCLVLFVFVWVHVCVCCCRCSLCYSTFLAFNGCPHTPGAPICSATSSRACPSP